MLTVVAADRKANDEYVSYGYATYVLVVAVFLAIAEAVVVTIAWRSARRIDCDKAGSRSAAGDDATAIDGQGAGPSVDPLNSKFQDTALTLNVAFDNNERDLERQETELELEESARTRGNDNAYAHPGPMVASTTLSTSVSSSSRSSRMSTVV